jgi:hypothetical protein
MRMQMRRFTRLDQHLLEEAGEPQGGRGALHFVHYNIAGIHPTLRVTPAVEAGVADHVWTLEEIAALAN